MFEWRFTFQLHYGGCFSVANPRQYIGGAIDHVDEIDPDTWSYFEMVRVLAELKLHEDSKIFWRDPKTGEVCPLETDAHVMEMFKVCNAYVLIMIYIVAPDESGPSQEDVQVGENADVNENELEENELEGVEDSSSDDGYVGSDDGSDRTYFGDEEEDCISDSDYLVDEDEAIASGGTSIRNGNGRHEGLEDVEVEEDVHSDYAASDELVSVHGSEDDEPGGTFPEFNKEKHLADPHIQLGMLFACAADFRALVRQHAIKHGYDIRFKKNDGDRVSVHCSEDCGWRIYASWNKEKQSMQIKTFVDTHHCAGSSANRQATSTWLSRKYMEQIRDEPNIRVKTLQKTVRRELSLDMKLGKAYSVKRKAIEKIEGDHKDQFKKLRDYCNMILNTNVGSLAILKVERPSLEVAPTFQRIFVSFAALRIGFVAGCRPFVGLDGCHLKGSFGGQLLSAIGRDANNQMFPVAFAVVEAETKDSWSWFMSLLLDAIGPMAQHGWTFISDRQKGLVETFSQLLPDADHRFCVRHMYANFKEKFKGKSLKDKMWAAASSYTVQEFELHMDEIKLEDVAAWEWLSAIHPTLWCRAHFSTRSKCDLLCNNISESFNKYILEAREKPILTLLEMIRKQLMNRLQNKRAGMRKFEGNVCPKIKSKLDKIKYAARWCNAVYAGEQKYEVEYENHTFVVDLEKRSCTCKQWDLCGVPCKHSVAAMGIHKQKPEEYVDSCYHVESYKKSYENMIYPIPDHTLWSASSASSEVILPPPFRKAPGRPKKARRRAPDEPKAQTHLSRVKAQLKCSRCQEYGHNTRTCPSVVAVPPPVGYPGGRGRGARGGRPPLNAGRGGGGRVNQGEEAAPPAEGGVVPGGGRGRGAGRGRGNGLGRGGEAAEGGVVPGGGRGRGRGAGRGRGRGNGAGRGGEAAEGGVVLGGGRGRGNGARRGRGGRRGGASGRGAAAPRAVSVPRGRGGNVGEVQTVQWFGGSLSQAGGSQVSLNLQGPTTQGSQGHVGTSTQGSQASSGWAHL